MRPNTSSKMPHTMTDVVDDPVDGMVPGDVADELPPAGSSPNLVTARQNQPKSCCYLVLSWRDAVLVLDSH